jgi:hypothetical protein
VGHARVLELAHEVDTGQKNSTETGQFGSESVAVLDAAQQSLGLQLVADVT